MNAFLLHPSKPLENRQIYGPLSLFQRMVPVSHRALIFREMNVRTGESELTLRVCNRSLALLFSVFEKCINASRHESRIRAIVPGLNVSNPSMLFQVNFLFTITFIRLADVFMQSDFQ